MQGLERLHYFNGQRLVARDLEVEQAYHMRVRRLLNRGLYSAGVVNGLQITIVDPRHVSVSNGLALDPPGREITLLADTTLAVPPRPPTSPLGGYFLVIRYAEEVEAGRLADCRGGVGATPPARVREAPVLAWTETWPDHRQCGTRGHPSDCAIVLGLVLLNASCEVTRIEPGVRQYAQSQLPRQVHPFALEGEKDIDARNPKRLHFQINGGHPAAVQLYLWGDAISSLYYTEVGSHRHPLSAAGGTTPAAIADHAHSINGVVTSPAGLHSHEVSVQNNLLDDVGSRVQLVNVPLITVETYRRGNPLYLEARGEHVHIINGVTGSRLGSTPGTHSYTLSGSTDAAGNTPSPASTPYQ